MKEIADSFRNILDSCGEFTEVTLNAISLTFIILGTVMSFVRTIQRDQKNKYSPTYHVFFRMTFGAWLVVALEFQLAADIVGTIISPTYPHLIQLGAVALIRTFLNYFLNRELNEEMRSFREESENKKTD